ncbi:Aldo/keto reductase, 4Fe-4S-containing, TM1183 family [Olavius algarvensis Delta 1 endosymbiont]|nr:Aldo/keto reductase, 4Fe-4S-containing, TM1183 family [Olavius algarvensis Delta 1 endosymbiont]
MKYRKFGNLDWDASVLGFGVMRMPVVDNDPARIDESEAIKMIRYAIDQGVNYIDTAYTYHGEQSEVLVGKALGNGYRSKVKIATKLPSWLVDKPDDFDRFLDKQLEKLQTDHIDFYLLHALNSNYWPKLRDWDVLKWAEDAIADGRIHHLGFSFHDEFDVFKDIVDAYDGWIFCQIQYNFMDVEYQAGLKGLQYAADKGLAVVVMEPLRGGQLTTRVPPSVADLWQSATVHRTPADWALQWIWNHPQVTVLLSGMSTMQHVIENTASADRVDVVALTEEELVLVGKVREEYRRLVPVPCTNCNYCLPCPNSVEIAEIFEHYNDANIYDNPRGPRFHYGDLSDDQRADSCVECFECEEKCPQGIPVVEYLKKAHALLGEDK